MLRVGCATCRDWVEADDDTALRWVCEHLSTRGLPVAKSRVLSLGRTERTRRHVLDSVRRNLARGPWRHRGHEMVLARRQEVVA